jgi:predicted nucleotidyltransferase
MVNSNRKIIFKARVGSHLYGLNTPDSDEDFLGVYLPSIEDMIGLQSRPKEWTENVKLSTSDRNTKGDIDCKYLPIYTFLKEAAEGQSQSVELLFIPNEHIIVMEPEWSRILDHREKIISKDSLLPIIGFAKAQASKAVVKGSNLNKIRNLLTSLSNYVAPLRDITIKDKIVNNTLFNEEIEVLTNDYGFEVIRIAGRDYDVGLSLKRFKESLIKLEAKYGTRVQNAAQHTYDFKSVTHAFRLCFEAEDLLARSYLTFPSPCKDFLMEVKKGNYSGDLDVDIEKRLDFLRELRDTSSLRDKPDLSALNKLCQNMILDYWSK